MSPGDMVVVRQHVSGPWHVYPVDDAPVSLSYHHVSGSRHVGVIVSVHPTRLGMYDVLCGDRLLKQCLNRSGRQEEEWDRVTRV